MIIKNLVLSGGGIKGLAICGCLEYLQENTKIFDTVEKIYGSSIGAYIAYFICLGIKPGNIAQIFEKVNLGNLQEFDIQLLLNEFGFDKGVKFANLLRATVITQGYDPEMTFAELDKISKYKLYICGTNITRSKPVNFSVETHPDMKVKDALRISGGYPIAFTPIKIDNELYGDGAIMCPLALDEIENLDETLGIAIHKSGQLNNTNAVHNYLMSIISCIIDSLTEKLIKSLKYIIVISYPLHAMEFDIDDNEKQKLRNNGKEMAEEWWKKIDGKKDNTANT